MKKLICMILACLLLMSLAGCSALLSDSEIRAAGTDMLDALLSDDYEGSYAMVSQACTEEEYAQVYSQFRAVLSGIETYELQLLQLNKNTTNGRTVTQAIYRIQLEKEPLLLSVALDSEVSGLVTFYLSVDDETVVSYNGDLSNMRDANFLQWAMLAVAALTLAFVIWMAVDCCRRKMKRKALWLVLILLGSVMITTTLSGSSFSIRYNLGLLLNHSALLRYTDGSFVSRLLIPAGAIVYFARRKKLSAPGEAAPEAEAEAALPQPEEPVSPPPETDE